MSNERCVHATLPKGKGHDHGSKNFQITSNKYLIFEFDGNGVEGAEKLKK